VFGQLNGEYEISYNIRVLKNTGAYFINRNAAKCCLEKMLPMYLPYDVALDQEWKLGFKTACITPFPVQLEKEMPSQIPRAKRIRFYRSTTFHFFHIKTHIERIFHRKRFFNQLKKG
jgi:glycosyl transferase family 25